MESNQLPPSYAHELQRLLRQSNQSLAGLLSVNPDLAFRMVQAILHTIRNQFDFEQSLRFLNQLPLSLKALYIDHWDIQEEATQLETLDELVDEIEKRYPHLMHDLQHNRQLVKQCYLMLGKLITYQADFSVNKLGNYTKQRDKSTYADRTFQDKETNTTESSIWLP